MKEEQSDNENLSRLRGAVGTITESIGKMAAALNAKLDGGDKVETKELKELTAAAKELSAVIRGLEEENVEGSEGFCIEFGKGADEWAK